VLSAAVARLIVVMLLPVGWSGGTLAAADGISSFVVKFRNEWGVPASAQILPSDARQALTAALGAGFSDTGRTRDGAFTIAFAAPLPFLEARAAVNRVREIAPVLYANIVAPSVEPGGRRTVQAAAATGIGTNQLIVKYRDPALISAAGAGRPPDQARIDRLSTVLGETVRYVRAMSGDAYVFRVSQRMPPAEADAAAARIALEPDVEYAEPDSIMQHTLVPNDSLYAANQWDLFEAVGGINAPTGWNTTIGTVGGIAADIDTGFLDHPDLVGRFVSNGYDFIVDHLVANDGDPAQPGTCLPTSDPLSPPCISSRDSDAHDPGDWISAAEAAGTDPTGGYFHSPIPCPQSNSSWHGTHTAGTIAAASNNAAGIAGINWLGKILPARVLGKCGGYTSDISDAIVWTSGGGVAGVPANATPARVMNLSLGGGGACSATFQNAINTALANNAVVVVAAGNGNTDAANQQPANCNGVITVAATQRAGARASYSNYGSLVEIAAPGGGDGNGILSTLNNGTTTPSAYVYAFYQGTSMATPHVTGVISLMVGVNASLTPAQVAAKLQATARAFPTGTGRDCTSNLGAVGGGVQYCGAGILDMAAAVASACAGCATSSSRLLVPDGTSETQTFTAYPETRWFAMTVEPGKTYVIDTADPSADLTANAIGTLNVFAGDGVSAPPEANVDCTAANGPRPPAVDVNSDGIRCVLRTALPNGTLLNKRPVFIKVTRMDPAAGGGSQFKIRAREATIYGRWLTAGYEYHVEVENTTGDPMCVEVARYPAAGLTYTPGPGWSGAIASFMLTVPAFGAVKQVIPNGSLVGSDNEGTLRISACNSQVNLDPGALHVSTFGFDSVANRFIHYFTSTANEGKTRSSW
jgi:serine protease